jgi:hypothetical protein
MWNILENQNSFKKLLGLLTIQSNVGLLAKEAEANTPNL